MLWGSAPADAPQWSFKDRLAMELATVGGSGWSPKAPGTVGTIASIPLGVLAMWGGFTLHMLLFVLSCVIGLWASERGRILLKREDPGSVVIDETAGLLLTLFFVPFTPLGILAGFILFRLFDIWKPWPIGWLDRHIHGGLGIMVDDLVAGLMAGGLLWWALPFFSLH
uniref:Phosphatidylglycerophosphatase A n=1 Tax=Magnetococcus massalia (strain MO-1) TaxID=451514 RepID=A0A1S7LN04_MAGMO|nr:Phosphatidylglycerophosphatase A [Candidatus Magnetococcus massalia]